MTFHYDPTTPLGRVRFYLDDKVKNKGPYPGKENFSNEELNILLEDKNNNINDVVVVCLQTLSAAWASYAVEEEDVRLRFNAQQVSKDFADRAEDFRKNPIDKANPTAYGVVTITRVDHYNGV